MNDVVWNERRYWPGFPATAPETHFGRTIEACVVDRPATVNARLDALAREQPGRDAVIDGAVRLSHAALAAAARDTAARLAGVGVVPGDRVALLLRNRHEFVVLLRAVLSLGAIAVPLNVRMATPELAQVLGHCGAVVLVHDEVLTQYLPSRHDLPALRSVVPVETLDSLPTAGSAPHHAHEDDVALLLYTSGTTGVPKGAMLTHFNLVHSCLHFGYCYALTARDRAMLAVPASHVTGVVAMILAPLFAGGSVVVLTRFKAADFLALASAEGMTYTVLVPAMYKLCLMQPDFRDHDLAAWRVGAYGGAPMPQSTIAELEAALPCLSLSNAYGATETTSPTTLMPLQAGLTAAHADSVGQPVPCARVRVVGSDGEEVAAGEPGELHISGPMVIPGYWNDPPAAAGSFMDGAWRSGDVGSMDEHGFVRVFDRLKDLVNRGGYKVYSVEVENALSYHPAVLEAAVVAMPDPVLGEKVHAIVHCREGARPDEASLRAFCAERLADYKLPDRVTFFDEPLPRNAAGKLLKRELRGMR